MSSCASIARSSLPAPHRLADLDAELARRSFAEFVKQAWPIVEPAAALIWGPHMDALCDHLQAVAEGRIHNLLINIPPGHSKSLVVAVLWPAWIWARRPEWRGLFSSYAGDLAIRDSVKCRALVEDEWYRGSFMRGWELSSDQNVKSYFQNTRMGFRAALSVGGKTTGFRGDCIHGASRVSTEIGDVRVERLVEMNPLPKVWAFDHSTGEARLRRVEAFRVLPSRKTMRVATKAGRVLQCTHDHRIFNSDQGTYVSAGGLSPGVHLPVLRGPLVPPERPRDPVPRVLGGGPRVPGVSSALPAGGRGACQGDQAGRQAAPQLLENVCVQAGDNERRGAKCRSPDAGDVSVRRVRGRLPGEGARGEAQAAEVLLGGVRGEDAQIESAGHDLPDLRDDLPATFDAPGLLLKVVREHGSLDQDAGSREFALQDGHQLRRVVPPDAAAHPRQGRPQVRGLRCGGGTRAAGWRTDPDHAAGAPHQRRPVHERADEPDLPLQGVPPIPPQVGQDAVSVVEPEGEGRDTVYDLQVEGDHNFFAEGILVHNCVVVDDPLNAVDAHSKASRDAAIRWFDQAMGNRLNDLRKGVRVVIMQRLHQEDLSGHLLEAGGWEHLCLPSEFEPARRCSTGIGWKDWREKPGELLFPQLFPAEVVSAEKRRLGALGFAGQHQQRPSPAEGNLFRRSWWRRWHRVGEFVPEGVESRLLPEKFDDMLISVDCAFKDTSTSDFVAMGVWGRSGPDRFLVDQVRDRMGFSETVKALLGLIGKHPRARARLIEDKANGSAVVDVLRRRVPGMIAVNPEGGKESRAAAVSPEVESGNVFIPLHADWVSDFVEEHAAFPTGANDDQVDQTTQALLRFSRPRSGAAATEALAG